MVSEELGVLGPSQANQGWGAFLPLPPCGRANPQALWLWLLRPCRAVLEQAEEGAPAWPGPTLPMGLWRAQQQSSSALQGLQGQMRS